MDKAFILAGFQLRRARVLQKIIFWTGFAAAIVVILWITGADHSRSMEKCEQTHSRDTCLYSLR